MGGMSWTITGDLAGFLAAAGPLMAARAAEHTVLLTVSDTLRGRDPGFHGGPPARFGWWRGPSGAVEAALLWTPPRPVQVGPLPAAAAAALAAVLAEPAGDAAPSAVQLPAGEADAFAAAWRRHTGGDVTPDRTMRLHRLGTLVSPDPAPAGRPRTATAADRDLLAGWLRAFAGDVGLPWVGADAGSVVEDRLAHGGAVLWEDAAGVPVATAWITRPLAGQVRITHVYTPPAHRRRGYAGAVTAEAGRRAVEAGAAEVLLFTDLANPTSNALYRRLGYLPVADRVELALARRAPAGQNTKGAAAR
jgi:GNAT superfamily N-acetyltransferase